MKPIVTNLQGYDNMTLEDAQDIYMHIEKKQILNGYTFPKKPCKDGYYRIYVTDASSKSGRKQLAAKSIDTLMDKVYFYEKGIKGKCRKTFSEAFELAIEEKLRYVSNPEKLVSMQNTVNRYRCDYRRFFVGTDFEKKYVDCIGKNDIEDLIFNNLKRYSLREKALKGLLLILRMTFELAYEQNWIQDNTYKRLNIQKFNGMLADSVPIEKRVHSEEELVRITKELHEHQKRKPDYLPAYALELQIIIGARRGEIPPLRRTDIANDNLCISREQITVKKYKDKKEHCVIVNHTKTGKNRIFPRSTTLNSFLERLFTVLDQYYPDSEYLFPANTDTGVISNNTVYNYYRRVCKKLGINLSRDEIKGTHSFRRNAITDVVNATGGNLILASALFGNSPEVAKKNYYTGINRQEALQALNKRKLS